MSRVERERRGAGYQINRIVRAEIERYENTSMRLVDVLTAQVPGVRITRSGVVGQPTCLEFRGARAGNFMRGLGSSDPGCNSPEVYLDGVLVHNPATLFGTLPIEDHREHRGGCRRPRRARVSGWVRCGERFIINTRQAVELTGEEAQGPDDLFARAAEARLERWKTTPHASRRNVFLGAAAGECIVGLAAGVVRGQASCISFRGSGRFAGFRLQRHHHNGRWRRQRWRWLCRRWGPRWVPASQGIDGAFARGNSRRGADRYGCYAHSRHTVWQWPASTMTRTCSEPWESSASRSRCRWSRPWRIGCSGRRGPRTDGRCRGTGRPDAAAFRVSAGSAAGPDGR